MNKFRLGNNRIIKAQNRKGSVRILSQLALRLALRLAFQTASILGGR